ncbi:MAG: acetolactate synthase large subunit [Acidobacteriota bacterium]
MSDEELRDEELRDEEVSDEEHRASARSTSTQPEPSTTAESLPEADASTSVSSSQSGPESQTVPDARVTSNAEAVSNVQTVSELFVRCLEIEGVRFVFGVPGEENEDFLFALEDSPIHFVATRHEQGAAFIANVWGRITGEAGVCLATLGPGATNLVTGLADANLDKAPTVAITAQGGLDRLHHESHQWIDIVAMLRPITKWNTTLSAPSTVTEVVRKAFKEAEQEKPGVTHVELPEDVAALPVPDDAIEPLVPRVVRRPAPDHKALRRAVERIERARRPLVLAGNGAIRKLASKHLRQLVERFGIPVAHTFMGKGAVSDRSEHSLLAIGLGFHDYVIEAVEQADLVVTVGYDIAEYPPERWNPDASKPIIHIDFDPAEVYSHYHPQVEIVADVSATLWKLERQLAESALEVDRGWTAPIRRRILDDLDSYRLRDDVLDDGRFTIPGALAILRDEMDDDALMISDVGSHKMWIARNFPTFCAGGCLISNGLASMGIALPGGIAASLIDSGRQVVAAMGDGGFLMNVQELETAVRLGVSYTVVVFRDDDYGLISWKQRRARGRSVSTEIGNPDLVALGEAFGLRACRPRTVSELRERFHEAIRSDEMWLFDVPVDPRVNSELVQKLDRYFDHRST